MKLHYTLSIFAFLLFSATAFSQDVSLKRLTDLSTDVQETSGLLFLDGKVIGHNDSGTGTVLFEMDTLTGNQVKSVTIGNASNVDWEDIAADDTYIYIGDIGNNNGNRTDLKIYRILLNEFLAAENNATVNAESIAYSYADQSDFTSDYNNNNWDAEALIAYNDSLYIFTKNWINKKTHIYSLPKDPGTYSAKRVDELNVAGLITGADYNSSTSEIMLTSYDLTIAFTVGMVKLKGFSGNHFSEATLTKKTLSTMPRNFQVESVAWMKNNQCYIASESNATLGKGWFGRVTWIDPDIPTQISEIQISANSANGQIYVSSNKKLTTYIYGMDGRLLMHSAQNPVNASQLESGIYILRFVDANQNIVDIKKVRLQ